MARLFRVWVEVHPPNDNRPHYCVEVFRQVRTATPLRTAHFSVGALPEMDDVAWIGCVLEDTVNQCMYDTIGIQQPLG